MAFVLPEEFQFGHHLAFVLVDMLTDHIVHGEKARLLFFEMKLNKPEDLRAMEGLAGEDFWRWCEANGYRHVLDEHSHRNLIFGLLSDMCHFLYEGMKCSEKGKLSVAFSNFRKPLQDNLFFLEWILADWPGFLAKFKQGPEHVDFGRMEKDVKKAMRVDIIGKAMDRTPAGRWFDPEEMYVLRYEKASDYGLDPIFNKALHLVTTFKHYATEPENINFIFCGDDSRESLWQQLYLLLPTVLIHALHVTQALFKTLAPEFQPHSPVTDYWLMAGYFLWAQRMGGEEDREFASTTFNELLEDLTITCDQCATEFKFDQGNLLSLWESGKIACRTCGREVQAITMDKRPWHYEDEDN